MRSINIATAFALATVAKAFAIPSGAAKVVYAVIIGGDGKEVHTKISDSTVSNFNISDSTNIQTFQPNDEITAKDLGGLERRGPGRIWCGCGWNVNTQHCDKAVELLWRK